MPVLLDHWSRRRLPAHLDAGARVSPLYDDVFRETVNDHEPASAPTRVGCRVTPPALIAHHHTNRPVVTVRIQEGIAPAIGISMVGNVGERLMCGQDDVIDGIGVEPDRRGPRRYAASYFGKSGRQGRRRNAQHQRRGAPGCV